MDPRDVAEDYLEKHKICQLFESIMAQVLFHKPDNPKQYIVQLLESIKASQGATPELLDETDFKTMFGMFDITKRGAISREQAEAALKSVMGPTASLEAAGEDVPNFVSQDEFVRVMLRVYTAGCQQPLPFNFTDKGLRPRWGKEVPSSS